VDDLEQLARLKVATVSGHLPIEVGRWAVSFAESRLLSAAARRRKRDTLLRRAANLIDGSLWKKTIAIYEIAERLREDPAYAWQEVMERDSAAEYVQRAWHLDQALPQRRQLMNILNDSAIEGY